MDIRNMRQLVAIRSHGSFAKASRELGMSQPSLSTAIARLEDELGVKLFDRNARGSVITPIGELIADRAGRVIDETQDIFRDASLVAAGEAGSVRVGLGAPMRDSILPKLLVQIAEQFPALSVYVEVSDQDLTLPRLDSRELDIVFCSFGPEVERNSRVHSQIVRTPRVAVVSPTHRLSREAGPIRTERLADFRVAAASSRLFRAPTILGLAQGVPNLTAFTTNDYAAVLPLVMADHAVLIVPLLEVRREVADGRLVVLDIDGGLGVATLVAVMARSVSHSPILTKIVALARALGEEIECEDVGTPASGLAFA